MTRCSDLSSPPYQKIGNELLMRRRGSHRSRLLKKHHHKDEKMIEVDEAEPAHREDNLKERESESPPYEDLVVYNTEMPSNTPMTDDYATSTSPPQGDASDGEDTAPVFHSKTNKEGKAHKVSNGVCTKRLQTAFDEIMAFPGSIYAYPGKEGVIKIQTPEDVKKLCAFVPSFPSSASYNYGCSFFYMPSLRGEVNYFPKGVKEYIAINPDSTSSNPLFQQWASVDLYCSCYQGYDLGCSNELPTTPQEKEEYCEFAGVWNGDVNITDVVLSQKMLDCGCFWIREVTTEVGKCPGVDLGWWRDSL